MKRVTFTVPATVTLRVPNSWGLRRAARELTDTVIVKRGGGAKLQPSNVQQIQLGAVDPEEIQESDDDA